MLFLSFILWRLKKEKSELDICALVVLKSAKELHTFKSDHKEFIDLKNKQTELSRNPKQGPLKS